MMAYDFFEKLEFSLGEREKFDIDVLKSIIPNCVSVEKTLPEVDKTGVDYIATLRRGAVINIDTKRREQGASKWWHHGEPELALETWSVVEEIGQPGKVGWTLSESSPVDYILYLFDRSDTDKFYFLPFQLLRIGFMKCYNEWSKKYLTKRQRSNNGEWCSEAIFVPASKVLDEINRLMVGVV